MNSLCLEYVLMGERKLRNSQLCNDYYLVLKGSNFASIHLAKIIPQQMSFLFSNYMATAGMCDPLIKRLRIIGNHTLKDMKC